MERIFRFGPGEDAEFWIGSADLMHRNLDRRVEALVKVTHEPACGELAQVFDVAMSDDCEGFDLAGDGSWQRRVSTPDRPMVHLQDALVRRIIGSAG